MLFIFIFSFLFCLAVSSFICRCVAPSLQQVVNKTFFCFLQRNCVPLCTYPSTVVPCNLATSDPPSKHTHIDPLLPTGTAISLSLFFSFTLFNICWPFSLHTNTQGTDKIFRHLNAQHSSHRHAVSRQNIEGLEAS